MIDLLPLTIRHEGGGLLAFYRGNERIRDVGITPGWDFKDRDEVIHSFNRRAEANLAAQSASPLKAAVSEAEQDAAAREVAMQDGLNWDIANEEERDYYRNCAVAILEAALTLRPSGGDVPTGMVLVDEAALLKLTEPLPEHSEDWDGPCWCPTCQTYAAEDAL